MKKIGIKIFGFFILNFLFISSSFAAACDQSFNGGFLRYDKTYQFYDVWNNNGTQADYMNDFWIHYKDSTNWNEGAASTWSYLDPGTDFQWTSTLKSASYRIPGKSSMEIINTGPTNWRIKKHPTVRTSGTQTSYDFGIRYKISYDNSNNYPNTSDDILHTECVYYSVTWCGDGVRDTSYETCDPKDTSKAGWGNGGCNNSCQPINVDPPATCDNLTVSPATGVAPFTTSLSCTGTNATSFTIACGNGQTINGKTGTCTYATGGNYTPRCTVNTNITSASCQKTVSVTAPTPLIEIIKSDANPEDIDGNIGGNDSQTTTSGKKAVFKIRVTNKGNEALNNLKVTDTIAPNCAGSVTLPSTKPATWSNFIVGGSGNNSDAFLQPGEYFEYTCEKSNTLAAYDNRANTEGTGIGSGIKVTDTDDTKVLLIQPSIQVVKTDANPADTDGSQGNDTQTVAQAAQAVFKIRVTNNGTEALKNITLSDPVAPNCAGSVTLPSTKPAAWSNFIVGGSGNNSDAFLQPGEYFEYTCVKANTTVNYTNEAFVNAVGKDSNLPVNDDDPTQVKIVESPASCDSLSVAPFNGSAPLASNFTCTGTKATSFRVECGNGQIINSSTGTCTYTTAGTYTPKCFVNSTLTSPACTKTVTVSTPVNPQIQLVKSDANPADLDTIVGNDTQTVKTGSGAIFRITITNTGTETLENIVITDPIAPNCAGLVTPNNSYPSTFSGFVFTGNTDTLFQPGETFTYACSKSNTTANYTNTATVTARGITSLIPVTSTDPTQVIIQGPVPLISIDKRDANPSDRDNVVGNDTQTVGTGATAVFKIRVTNTGGEALKNIVLTDALAPNCSGNIILPSNKPATWSNLIIGGAGNHSNALLEVGEYFEYTCERGNTTSSYTNTASVRAVGDITAGVVNDTDDTPVLLDPAPERYDLALKKILSSATPGPFNIGDTVVFNIEVINQGNIPANNIQVVDYIPAGLTLNDAAWTQSGATLAYRTISRIDAGDKQMVSIRFTIATNAPSSITNLAEISRDDGNDCDSTPDTNPTNDGTPVDNEVGTVCEPGGDEDDHDPETITIDNGSVYDLALKKVLSGATPGPFQRGDTVTFDIKVKNQGTLPGNNIQITDYIPTGLNLTGTGWTLNGTMAQRIIPTIAPGQEITLSISFIIDASAPSSITNLAEISSDDGSDCDSTPDMNPTNDGTPVDNEIGTGCEPGGDEDDHDPETITLVTSPISACTNLTASPTSQQGTLTSNLSCTGSGAITYKIEVRNSAGTLIETLNQATGTVTLTTQGDYTASCFVNGETTTPPVCQKTLKVTGGSGGTPSCNDIIQSGTNFTCYGSNRTNSIMMECGTLSGSTVYLGPKNGADITIDPVSSRRSATFNCTGTTTPRCYVSANVTNTIGVVAVPNWYTDDSCTIQTAPVCGDGVVQSERGETCDYGPALDWHSCNRPGTANECKIPSSSSGTPSSTSGTPSSGDPCISGDEACPLTTPNDGELMFGPTGHVIIGHDKNPVLEYGEKPYLYNNSDYDFSFDAFCIKKIAGDGSVVGAEQCLDLGNDMIYAYERIEFPNFPLFTSNKNNIPAGNSYGTGRLTTSVKDGGLEYYTAYFAGDLDVRVAKPAVTTVGGGTTYIKNTETTGDLQKVTSGVTGYENNKNFVGTSVGTSSVSSYTQTVTNTVAVSEVEKDKTYTQTISKTITGSTVTTGPTITSFTQKYNGLGNVYIVNTNNVRLSSFPAPSEPTTYIVENGNLYIDVNIISSKNIAFVVKGGNIIIDKDVTHLDGTYITIPVSGVGGKIESSGETSKQLVFDGSVYGNLTNLVNDRTYISKATSGTMLSVGTIVSFGSSIFHKPAPLVGQFIAEYLDTTKVAR